MYILVSKEGQAQYDTYEEAASAYEALEDNRGAYIKRVKKEEDRTRDTNKG